MQFKICSAVVAAGLFPAVVLGQATPFRGTHVGFDTATGAAGEQLLLKTGYGTSGAPESEMWAWRFQNGDAGGQLQTRTKRHAEDPNAPFDIARYNLFYGAPATVIAAEGGGASPVAGWYAQSSIAANPVTHRQTFNPTGADAFVAAGRLDGGSFFYEIIGVTPLNGSPSASFAMGLLETTGISNDSERRLKTIESGLDVFGVFDPGQGGGGSLADRSINVGFGNHFHGWGFFLSGAGTYEVSMRVHDANGKYAASEAFSFQVTSIPAPGAVALAGVGAVGAWRRRRA